MRDRSFTRNPRATTERVLNTEKRRKKWASNIYPCRLRPTRFARPLTRTDASLSIASYAPKSWTRSRDELRPFTEATPLGADDFSGRRTRRTGGLDRALAEIPRARDESRGARRGRQDARSCDQLSTPSHADNLDRPRRARPDDSSRPMGVRFLPVPARLRSPVQHDLGDDRLHRGKRRDARDSRQQSLRRQAALHRSRHRAGRDDQRVGALLHRQHLSRRRREPLESYPHRNQHHLQRLVAPPGRKSIPIGAAGNRAHAPGRPACD